MVLLGRLKEACGCTYSACKNTTEEDDPATHSNVAEWTAIKRSTSLVRGKMRSHQPNWQLHKFKIWDQITSLYFHSQALEQSNLSSSAMHIIGGWFKDRSVLPQIKRSHQTSSQKSSQAGLWSASVFAHSLHKCTSELLSCFHTHFAQ